MTGLVLKSQALNTQDKRLSQRPLANLAIVLAESGATIIIELNFLSSIWSTGSVRFLKASHSS